MKFLYYIGAINYDALDNHSEIWLYSNLCAVKGSKRSL